MSLEGNIITSWEKMKQNFIEKYRDYCKAMDTSDEIFRIVKGESEMLEYYEVIFQIKVKRYATVSH